MVVLDGIAELLLPQQGNPDADGCQAQRSSAAILPEQTTGQQHVCYYTFT